MTIKGATPGAKNLARRNIEKLEMQIGILSKDNQCGKYNAAIGRLREGIGRWRKTLCAPTITVEEFGASFRDC